MKVLEILGEAEVAKPKLDPNGNPLKTTDTIEKPKLDPNGNPLKTTDTIAKPKLGPDGKPLKITDPNAKPKLGPDGKPLKITDPNQKPKSKSPATKNWQQKIFSEDAWMLLFHLGNKVDWGKERVDNTMISRLKRYYKSLILNPHFVTMESWQLDVQLESNLDIEGPYAEDVSSSLTRKVFAKLGITIGPSWRLKDAELGSNVTESYRTFWGRHLQVMRGTATSQAPLSMSSNPSDSMPLTKQDFGDIADLDKAEAVNIAATIKKYIPPTPVDFIAWIKDRFWNPGANAYDLIKAVESIKHPKHFAQVSVEFKVLTDVDLMSALKKIDIDDGKRKQLDNWLRYLNLPGTSEKDPNNWSNESRDKKIEIVVMDENNKWKDNGELKKFIISFDEDFKTHYKDAYNWTQDGGQQSHIIWSQSTAVACRKEAKKNKGSLTVAQIIYFYNKIYLKNILSSYNSLK